MLQKVLRAAGTRRRRTAWLGTVSTSTTATAGHSCTDGALRRACAAGIHFHHPPTSALDNGELESGGRGSPYSTCYALAMSSALAEAARHADHLVAKGRAELIYAVRQAAAAGKTQAQIAAEIGRSQPEVSRLLRFHGTSPLGRRLRKHVGEVKRLVAAAGGRDVRVFGSVATGNDHEGSDIDLLFTVDCPLSMMQLGALEREVSQVVGSQVDLVPDNALRPEFRDRILAEAVAL